MPETSPPASAVTLRRFAPIARRRFWLVALCAILVPTSVVGYSLAQENRYEATASLLFRDSGPVDLLESTPQSQNASDDRTAATNQGLAGLEVVAARTARRLGLGAGDIAGNVEITPVESSNLTQVTATDANPRVAAQVANTYAEEFIELRRRADVADIERAQGALRARLRAVQRGLGARGRKTQEGLRGAERQVLSREREGLLERQGRLSSLARLATGNVELAQRASAPTAPASPKTRRNAVIGLGLGVVLGIALALLFEMLDRRLREPAEVTELVDLPILGTIPHSRALAEPPNVSGLPAVESQAFDMLRASLRYQSEDRPLDSVLVTSAGARDGKTTVAMNLASVSARAGERVLLLEADLRRPSLAARFRVQNAPGLSDVLRGDVDLEEVISEVVVGAGADGSREPYTVDVIVAGAVRGDVTGLMESERMDHVVRTVQARYDLVVLDTPPMSVVPDAIPLMGKVSGVLVVMRLGRTTRDAVSFLSSQLTHIGARGLGAVVNSISRQDGYYYDAAYDSAARSRRKAAPVGGN
jgi:capsular exopolysaccharide synthesis family protein